MKTILFPVPPPGSAINAISEFCENPNVKVLSQETVMVPHVRICYESLSDPDMIARAVKYESRQQRRLCEIAERVITKDAYVKLVNATQRKEYLLAFEGLSVEEAERVIELAKREMEPVRRKLLEGK